MHARSHIVNIFIPTAPTKPIAPTKPTIPTPTTHFKLTFSENSML